MVPLYVSGAPLICLIYRLPSDWKRLGCGGNTETRIILTKQAFVRSLNVECVNKIFPTLTLNWWNFLNGNFSVCESKIRYFQFRLLHKILPTNSYLTLKLPSA